MKRVVEYMLEGIEKYIDPQKIDGIDVTALAEYADQHFEILGPPPDYKIDEELRDTVCEIAWIIQRRISWSDATPTVGWVMKRWTERFGKRGSPGVPVGKGG